MTPLESITAVEQEYLLPPGQPSLGRAYALLKGNWQAGARDTETALRLLFLAWYANVEPLALTGLPGDEDTGEVFRGVFAEAGGEGAAEGEVLFAVGMMCDLFPWAAGPEEKGRCLSERCLEAARRARPEGFPPGHFRGRGAYGAFFDERGRHRGPV